MTLSERPSGATLQLHYTSCRSGQSGNAGFQVRALSAGITPDEQREIERQGVYRPPRDAPEDATAEAIERDYPVALRFYLLGSGRRALTRSCYSGQDYSGRWGNFFAHTLVFEDVEFEAGAVPPLWPMDYYEWPCWQARLEPAEDTEELPPPLPAVDLGEMEPAESFRLEEISEFLCEEPGREQLLARMGRAVLLGLEDSRALVIRDTPTHNAYWIASIQKLFPPHHAATLSYSSYQEDPRDCATINATTGETDFTFGDSERRYQFYMFDLVGHRNSEVPEVSDYPAVAAHWLAKDPAELERFFEFMQRFKHRAVEPSLLSALHLFELFRRRDRHLEGEELSAMIRFATRWTRTESRVDLAQTVAAAVERAGGLRRVADYEGVIRFLAEGASVSGQPRHRELTFTVWLQLLDEQVIGRGCGLETAWICRQTLEDTLRAHAVEWARRLLDGSRVSRWRGRLSRLDPEILSFLLHLTWRGLDLIGRRPVWEQPEVEALVRALISGTEDQGRTALTVLEAVPAEAEVLAAMSRFTAAGAGDSRSDRSSQKGTDTARATRITVGRALGRILVAIPPVVAAATRLQLDDVEGWDLLYGEWLEICETAKDPRAAFGRYQRSVLAVVPGYGSKCSPWIGKSLLDHLPEPEGVSLALEWLGSKQAGRLSGHLARRCVELANHAVKLDSRSRRSERTARLVADAAVRWQVALRPDRPALRRVLARLSKARSESELGLEALAPALASIDVAEYRYVLAVLLRPALELTGAMNGHRQVLLALLRAEHATLFEKAYRGFFREQRKGRWSESLQGALKLWLSLDPTRAGDEALAKFEKTAFDELARTLIRLPARRYQSVRQRVRRYPDRVMTRWQYLEGAIEARKRGPLARLKGFLFRGSIA